MTDALIPYCQYDRNLFGYKKHWTGCRTEFPFRVFEVGHIIPQRRSGQNNIENLQLLCAHCNRVKGDRPQEFLLAKLRELRVAA